MKKTAAVLGPIVAVIMMVPFLTALMVTAIASPAAGQELMAIAVTIRAARNGTIMITATMGPRTAAVFFIGAALRGNRQYSWELLKSGRDRVVGECEVELERVEHGLD